MCSPSVGGARPDRRRRLRQRERHADLADDAPRRVLLGHRHPEGGRLGRIERRDDVVDRAARDLRGGESGQPRVVRALAETLGEKRAELVSMLDPVAVAREPRIGRELGHAERRTEPQPLALRADGDGDRAVGGLERLVRNDVGVRVAEPARRHPGRERVLRLVDETRESGAEERDIDTLAACRPTGTRPTTPSRPRTAASTLTAPSMPVTTSAIATPTFVGDPPSGSGAPVIDMRPLAAWITKS